MTLLVLELVVAMVEAQVGPMMTGKGSGDLFLLTVFVFPMTMRGLTLPLLAEGTAPPSLGRVAASAILKAGTVVLFCSCSVPLPLISMSSYGTERSAILDA